MNRILYKYELFDGGLSTAEEIRLNDGSTIAIVRESPTTMRIAVNFKSNETWFDSKQACLDHRISQINEQSNREITKIKKDFEMV